jgi:hypothetical protein
LGALTQERQDDEQSDDGRMDREGKREDGRFDSDTSFRSDERIFEHGILLDHGLGSSGGLFAEDSGGDAARKGFPVAGLVRDRRDRLRQSVQLAQKPDLAAAFGTTADMALDPGGFPDRKLAVVPGAEEFPDPCVAHVRLSFSLRLARASRDITVPTAMWRVLAISR